jgi:hypothetical protein
MYSEGMICCCTMVKSRSCLETRGAAPGTIAKYEMAYRMQLSVPDLIDTDDSGLSFTDNITNVKTPHFQGTAIPQARVDIFAQLLPGGPVVLVGSLVCLAEFVFLSSEGDIHAGIINAKVVQPRDRTEAGRLQGKRESWVLCWREISLLL